MTQNYSVLGKLVPKEVYDAHFKIKAPVVEEVAKEQPKEVVKEKAKITVKKSRW